VLALGLCEALGDTDADGDDADGLAELLGLLLADGLCDALGDVLLDGL